MEEVFDKIKEHANKAKDSAVQVTKTVIEKTNNIVNQTKLKFSISETKSKIKDIYTEIGKSVYETYKSKPYKPTQSQLPEELALLVLHELRQV